jgi:hypothetical protein
MVLAGTCTYVPTALSHIDCGGDPASCEPAVERAANVGLLGQGAVFAVAIVLLAKVNRERLRSVVVVVIGASIVMGMIAWNLARAAVDAQ